MIQDLIYVYLNKFEMIITLYLLIFCKSIFLYMIADLKKMVIESFNQLLHKNHLKNT